MMYARLPQSSQKCPMCGSAVPPGGIMCPTCGEDLTKASMVVSTSVRPLSRSLPRRPVSGSKALYMVLLAVVAATAVVGLGYVPAVSARVPQLASLSTAVEDTVNRAMQWGREMMGQPPAPPKGRPAAQPLPVPQNPAPVAHIPAVKPSTPKPASKPAAAKPAVRKPPVKPAAKPRPAAPAEALLTIGSRAPQFVVKDLRGVIYRLSDYRGRRVAVLIVSSLDESGRNAVRAFLNRFSAHPAYYPMIIITNADRVAVRRVAAAAEGTRVPILVGDEELEATYHLPRRGEALYIISETGAIAQARVFGRQ
jgi:hypothetical protein